MWKWLVNFISNLFGAKNRVKQLKAPAPPKLTNNDEIEVKLIVPQATTKEAVLFQDSILSVQKELGFTSSEEQLNQAVDKFVTLKLPQKYKDALKHGSPEIILTAYDFKGFSTLQKIYPLLKNRLAELGITKVKLPVPNGIFIDTENITIASEKWTRPVDSAEVWLNEKLHNKLK